MRPRGFSLIEMMGVVVILALLVGSFFFVQTRVVPKAPVRAVAERLAQVLRSAQSTAKTEGLCTAVVFPTGQGQTQTFQSYYLLKGMKDPEFVLARDTASESDGVYWTTAYDDSVGGITVNHPTNSLGLDFERWNAPYPQDHHLIFLPSGEVTSNGLPLYGDHFRLVVAEGFEMGPSAPSGTPPVSWAAELASLTTRPVCASVRISTDGTITVEDQIVGSTLSLLPKETAPPTNIAALPPGPARNQGILTLASPLQVDPDPNEYADFLPSSSTALVPEGKHLKMTVRATSSRGFPLFCEWNDQVVNGGPNGVSELGEYSSPAREPMHWNAVDEVWESSWSWAPPPNSVGADYQLNCLISDNHNSQFQGSQDTLVVRATVSNDPFRLGVTSDRVTDTNPTGEVRAYIARGDGTDFQEIGGIPETASWIAPSPNSQYIVRVVPKPGNRSALVINRRDGSGRIRVIGTPPGSADYFPQWSPGGTYVLFVSRTGNFRTASVWRANLSARVNDTITAVRVSPVPNPNVVWFTEPTISQMPLPNGNYRIAMTHAKPGLGDGADVITAEVDGQGNFQTAFSNVTSEGTSNCTFPWFHPTDPNVLVYLSNQASPVPTVHGFFRADLTATPPSLVQVSGTINTVGIAKYDGVGGLHFVSAAGSLYRVPSTGGPPELRVNGGVLGFSVNREGDVFMNRDFGGGNIDVLRLDAGAAPNQWRRLTTNPGFDAVFATVRLMVP